MRGLTNPRPSARRIFAYGMAVVFILAVYSYPALRTRAVTSSERLPVITAPDLGLYLSLSMLEKPRDGTVLNPYYRVEVPSTGAGFLKFRLSPSLFGSFTSLLSGRMWWSLFLWNLLWWSLACAAAVWLFERFLPVAPVELVLAALSMLMFFNFGMMKPLITAWLHFPSVPYFGEIDLPFIRPFSPQVALPLVLVYVGLQMLALERRQTTTWVTMVIVQLLAFASFPYATLMMAGTTAIASLADASTRRGQSEWRTVAGYGVVCAIADSIFLLRGASPFGHALPGEAPMIHFQAAVLPIQMGKLWIFMGVLSVAVGLSRNLAPGVRWSLMGLGITNMLLLMGDAVVPGPPLFLTNHASYFEHATITILLAFVFGAFLAAFTRHLTKLRIVVVLAICFFGVNGLLLAEGGYRRNLPSNRQQADMVNWFQGSAVGRDDLVITQYDVCAWVPFLSKAQVLFCRNAQAMLTAQQNHDIQRQREVWYLYFNGKDNRWVDSVIADPNRVHQLETYGFYGEVSSYYGEARSRQVAFIRSQLTPLFDRIERHDASAGDFFRGFKHVWIIEDAGESVFDRKRLETYFNLEREETCGGLRIVSGTAK